MLTFLAGILNFASRILRIFSWVLFFYGIISMLMPQWKLVQKVNSALNFLLEPVRVLLQKLFPSLANSSLDLSPLVLSLLVKLLSWLLSLIA